MVFFILGHVLLCLVTGNYISASADLPSKYNVGKVKVRELKYNS